MLAKEFLNIIERIISVIKNIEIETSGLKNEILFLYPKMKNEDNSRTH